MMAACPGCGSTRLQWAAEWARGAMLACCRACGEIWIATAYGAITNTKGGQ